LGVLTVGVLGVATLQNVITGQSQNNKTHAEALSIAQSRIEAMRNYTNSAATQGQFDTLYAATVGFANTTTITGVTAVFSRTESISANGSTKDLVVNVAWTNADGDNEDVRLATKLSFVAPRSLGDTALAASPSLVDAPTGRARLGEGTAPADAVLISNGDGTSIFNSGTESKLVAADSQIVLTLAQACQTDGGNCIAFVKIRGRVYIDKTSQRQLTPGEVYIAASDAAYCARYYTTAQGITNVVTPTTTSTVSTARGDYTYFDYTCYLGGGWHGNIGVILAGGLKSNDRLCIGDPVSVNAWEAPIIASRRAYRGMLYKHDLTNTTPGLTFNKQLLPGAGTRQVRYYTQGIKDSITLTGHNFVVGSMSSTASADCKMQGNRTSIMTQTDATISNVAGALFRNMPVDFICLNNANLDSYDTALFGHDLTCPYDPSDPPSLRHIVSGAISVPATQDLTNTALMASFSAFTSDGPGNCLTSPFSYSSGSYRATYQCDVFDWGNGWNGYTQVTYNPTISCLINKKTYTAVTADRTNENYACTLPTRLKVSGNISISAPLSASNTTLMARSSIATPAGSANCSALAFVHSGSDYTASYDCFVTDEGAGWTGAIDVTAVSPITCNSTRISYSAIKANQTGKNYTCTRAPTSLSIGGTLNIVGLSSPANATLAAGVRFAGLGASCATPTTTYSSGQYLVPYSCTVPDSGAGWTGTIAANTDARIACSSPVNKSLNFTAITANQSNQNYTCSRPSNNLAIAGSFNITAISSPANLALAGAVSFSGLGASCATPTTAYSGVQYLVSYSCTVPDSGAGWTGTIAATTDARIACSSPVTKSQTFTAITANQSNQNYTCSIAAPTPRTATVTFSFASGTRNQDRSVSSATFTTYAIPRTVSIGTCAVNNPGSVVTCTTTATFAAGAIWEGTVTLYGMDYQCAPAYYPNNRVVFGTILPSFTYSLVIPKTQGCALVQP